jgi:hypothetical protein
MGDDMEKKGQPGSQSHPGGQSGQHGPGQQGDQPGQYQPKKGWQNEDEQDDPNRDIQRRAS